MSPMSSMPSMSSRSSRSSEITEISTAAARSTAQHISTKRAAKLKAGESTTAAQARPTAHIIVISFATVHLEGIWGSEVLSAHIIIVVVIRTWLLVRRRGRVTPWVEVLGGRSRRHAVMVHPLLVFEMIVVHYWEFF